LDTPEAAALNSEFLTCLGDVAAGIVVAPADGTHGLGAIPPPVDLSHMAGQRLQPIAGYVGFPASYDLRTVTGKLSPIRDQAACGSCWAFATFGSLESALRPTESWDFSEMDLICAHGFYYGPCVGGNAHMSTAYLSRWDGPVNEACYPYNPPNCTVPRPSCAVQKHIQEVVFVPARGGSLDNDNIKQMVTTYGAVYTHMYYDGGYYNATTRAYYYSGTAAINHAVCIVGWDDNYSRFNFNSTPAGDGAFIVRNSWGVGWGENGYFYISYYDSKVGSYNAMFNNAEATSNYIRRYDYDPLGWVSSVGYGSNTAWFANIFTAAVTECLAAVSFYTASPNSSYEVYVYLDPTTGSPRAGTLAATKTGTIANPGYKTMVLNSTVSLTVGHKFSIVVKLTTPGYNYPVAYEYPYAGYSDGATASAGQSYISSSGSSWLDITTWTANSNVCLKGFTVPYPPTNPYANPSTICVGGSSTLSATPGAGGDTIAWYSGICGGTPVTSPVSPTSTTTYYAKTQNSTTGCMSLTCADGVTLTVNACPDNIASIRGAPKIGLDLRGIVTAKFADFMYVESADRSSGVRVTTAPSEVAVKDRIWFTGNTALVDGQKQITPSTPIVVLSRENALPELGMRHRDVGGVDYYNAWTATTGYDVGSLVVPTIWNGSRYACTVAGASGETEPGRIPPGDPEPPPLPPWPTELNATVVDGTVTWTNVGWDYIANPATDPGVYRGRGP
ncbi:MAG: lectin like domain-containing protein, partial [Armatimonadetes bacterium]|nr:lectin like domain-containing protein [Armatimonadota bacterium]